MLINTHPFPEPALQRADDTLCKRTVDAAAFGAVPKVSPQALFADGVGIGVLHHVVGADQLTVMGGVEDFTFVPGLTLPLSDFQDDTGGQLVVEIIQVAYVWLKILQNQADLFPGFGGIDGLDGVKKLRRQGAAVEVHITGIGIHPVAHDPALVLHAEILNLMALGLQLGTQLKNIGFRPSVGV